MTPKDFKNARIKFGFDQQKMAKVLGFKNGITVSQIETGKSEITDVRCRLLRAYLDGYRPDDWPKRSFDDSYGSLGYRKSLKIRQEKGHTHAKKILPVAMEMRQDGMKWADIENELDRLGLKTIRGTKITGIKIRALLNRYGNMLDE